MNVFFSLSLLQSEEEPRMKERSSKEKRRQEVKGLKMEPGYGSVVEHLSTTCEVLSSLALF